MKNADVSVNIEKIEERRLGRIVEKYLDNLGKLTKTEREVLLACIELYTYPQYLIDLRKEQCHIQTKK